MPVIYALSWKRREREIIVLPAPLFDEAVDGVSAQWETND